MICFYQKSSTTSLGAAFAVWLHYGDEGHNYLPLSRETAPIALLDDQDAVLIGFSFSRKSVLVLAERANSLVIVDNSPETLDELSGLEAEVEMQNLLRDEGSPRGRSITLKVEVGKTVTQLAWEHFHEYSAMPKFFENM
jgi:hypothetical protein